MVRAPKTLLPLLAAGIAVAGCGAGGDSAGRADRSAGAPAHRVSTAAGVTDGRTGDAVASADSGPLRTLSSGGALDPSTPPGGPRRRDGVGAGDACTETDLAPAADNLARVAASTLCLLNGERADHGLRPLAENAKLARAATGHSADMVAHSYFAHEGLDGSQIGDRIGATGYIPSRGRWVIGENLAWGTGALATPRSIVNAWMNSPGHRANVLHPDYREIGLGIVVGNPARPSGLGATYATEFGVTGASGASAPAEVPPSAPAAPRGSDDQRVASAGKKGGKRRGKKGRRARAARRRARAARARAARVRAKSAKARRADRRS
ncbi:MAG TPA: CAP domain-containing protein [Solirubrobacteraceae bacterium]|jgi:uncharacterized protein YkwD